MAKLGSAYKETSAAFIWSTIQRMYAARNSGLKKEMFGYVRGGYARVLEKFGEHLQAKGVEIRLNSQVEQIEKSNDGKIILSAKDANSAKEINIKKSEFALSNAVKNYSDKPKKIPKNFDSSAPFAV